MSTDLTRDLKQLADAGINGSTNMVKGKFPYYISRLEKLDAYFNAQAENAKGYFKDSQQRDMAMAALAQRENTARAMADALKSLDN
jgi:hypothetical protein